MKDRMSFAISLSEPQRNQKRSAAQDSTSRSRPSLHLILLSNYLKHAFRGRIWNRRGGNAGHGPTNESRIAGYGARRLQRWRHDYHHYYERGKYGAA